jgi:hypothetical protein
MTAKKEALPRSADLEQAIKHQIVQRTGRRIQGLKVEVSDDRLLIRGRAASFHLKQLAIQGVMDVIGSRVATQLQVEVQVSGSLPNSEAEDA